MSLIDKQDFFWYTLYVSDSVIIIATLTNNDTKEIYHEKTDCITFGINYAFVRVFFGELYGARGQR